MNEVFRSSVPENTVAFDGLCKKIQELYPSIQEIQFFIGGDKRVFFWITAQSPIEQEIFSSIQQEIMAEFAKNHHGFKCSIHTICQVNQSDIVSQNARGRDYIRELMTRIEAEFARDHIHLSYENGVFVIYGAAPRDHTIIRGAIMFHISHIVPCNLRFHSIAEWGEQNVKATRERTQRAFLDTDIPPSSQSLRPGLMTLLLGKTLGQKIFFRSF